MGIIKENNMNCFCDLSNIQQDLHLIGGGFLFGIGFAVAAWLVQKFLK